MATIKKIAKAAPKKKVTTPAKIVRKRPIKSASIKVSAPAKPVLKKNDIKKSADKTKPDKSVKKQIQEKLVLALSSYQPIIGDKKFHSLIKKASKSFSAEIQKANTSTEKKA